MRELQSKILDGAALRAVRERARVEGKVFVFTNGCFHSPHPGHDESHADKLIAELLPDVLVKGQDRADWVCGREIVEAHGGRVVLAPVAASRSTTGIIQRVLDAHGAASGGRAAGGNGSLGENQRGAEA